MLWLSMSCKLLLERFRYPCWFLLIHLSKWLLFILRFRDKLAVLALWPRSLVSISKFSITFSATQIIPSDSLLTTFCRNWFSKRGHFRCWFSVTILATYVSEILFSPLPTYFRSQYNLYRYWYGSWHMLWVFFLFLCLDLQVLVLSILVYQTWVLIWESQKYCERGFCFRNIVLNSKSALLFLNIPL